MDKKKIIFFAKKFFKPNQQIAIVFTLLVILALTPSIGYWKSNDKVVFEIGGNFCTLHSEEYDEVCRPEFYYWVLNKFLWPINLISTTTSQNSLIYADLFIKNYNQPSTTKAIEFPWLYLSSYFNEFKIFANEFWHVNKFKCLTEKIIPRILKPVILVTYWYLLSCLISFVMLHLYLHYKKSAKINLLIICSLFLISILCLIYGFYLGFFIPALEETKQEITGDISNYLENLFINYFPDKIPVGKELDLDFFVWLYVGIQSKILIILGSILFIWCLYKLVSYDKSKIK